jgi:hypothetical protein
MLLIDIGYLVASNDARNQNSSDRESFTKNQPSKRKGDIHPVDEMI